MHPRVAEERVRVLKGVTKCHLAMQDLDEKLFQKLASFGSSSGGGLRENIWVETSAVTKIVEIKSEVNNSRIVFDFHDRKSAQTLQ